MNEQELREIVKEEISKSNPPYGSMTLDDFKVWHRKSEKASLRIYLIFSVVGTPVMYIILDYIWHLMGK